MRFVAAQFNALLDGDLWLRNAAPQQRDGRAAVRRRRRLDGVEVAKPQVNGLFPTLPADVIAPLQDWSFFWDWDVASHQVRWMTSWDTTADDVDRFAGRRAPRRLNAVPSST